MSTIGENLIVLKDKLPNEVCLVAVSKTKPTEDINAAYQVGQRVFGENKVQEMCAKHEELPKDIQWHMIGHVQKNKIKYMGSFVSLIHGIDSISTIKEVNKQGLKHDRVIPILIQVKIAKEDSKFGVDVEQLDGFLTEFNNLSFKNVEIQGFMGMATNTPDQEVIKSEFSILKKLFDQYSSIYKSFRTLSMGMSGDYKLAIEVGSNMIRVGSAIFGKRNYDI
ncbi:MAG: YggS family pyridoxal phosphate-dependent enzyme [Flavobacteriaceae bacterium]